MTNDKFDALFGGPPRKPEELITQREMDLAASIQAVTEEVVLRLTRALAARNRACEICASPAASRSTASPTARSCATGKFEQIWIQPAAGDAGGALGAALAAYHLHGSGRGSVEQRPDGMHGAYLGPAYDAERDSRRRSTAIGAHYQRARRADAARRRSPRR